ncbi:nuclear transport factor 2 family protein [Streptomyces sp. NPDC003077]|uniref:nuclear transport factor 2 family protein n=1 Tax=Streptomyces sp. NPDC003077 TaxID=3154443 RepID=UPI0033B25FD9
MSLTTLTPERLRAGIEQFYARHLHLLDDGDAEAWAETFTEDGVFALPGRPEPTRGRAALAEGARRAHAERRGSGETHRHWHGMTDISPRDDGTVHVRCYALVVATPRGGDPRLHRSCVCEDVLVPVGSGWQVRSRRVTRDGF